MKEAPAPWHLHLPGAVRVQRACICSRINWSTKKLGGNAASCRHTSRLSWAAPSRVHSEAARSTGSFTCLLQYSGWAVQGQVCCCTSSHLVHLVKCHVCGGGGGSESTSQKLLLKFQLCGETILADCIQHPGCMELRSLQCRDDHSECWTESRLLLHNSSAFLAVTMKNMKMLKLNLFSVSTSSLRKSQPAMEFQGGKAPIKLMAFYSLSLCQQMINSWCWRCIWAT